MICHSLIKIPFIIEIIKKDFSLKNRIYSYRRRDLIFLTLGTEMDEVLLIGNHFRRRIRI